MTRLPDLGADYEIPAGRCWKLGEIQWLDEAERASRVRVIIDSDFMGGPDDLFQLVHHLLSPNAETRLIVSSHWVC